MSRGRSALRWAGAAAAALIMMPLAAEMDAAAAGTVAYEEDFEDGTTDIVTKNGAGTAEVLDEDGNHYLQLTRNTTTADGYFDASFGPQARDFDYTLRVKITEYKSEDWNWGKVYFRAKDWENDAYICELWGWRTALTAKQMEPLVDESVKADETQSLFFTPGEWYTMEIFARGNDFTVFVDGKKAVSMNKDLFSEGNFGFCGWGVNLAVDDIKIVTYADGEAPEPVTAVTTAAPPPPPTTLPPAVVSSAPESAETDASPAPGNSSGGGAGVSTDSRVTNGADANANLPIIIGVVIAVVVILAGGAVAAVLILRKGNREEKPNSKE